MRRGRAVLCAWFATVVCLAALTGLAGADADHSCAAQAEQIEALKHRLKDGKKKCEEEKDGLEDQLDQCHRDQRVVAEQLEAHKKDDKNEVRIAYFSVVPAIIHQPLLIRPLVSRRSCSRRKSLWPTRKSTF
jgi:septal ring factor EnvC (AmiA/AmiB activator)